MESREGNSWEDTPPRLARLFDAYPQMGEAWRDPLMEHYRETVLRPGRLDPRLVATGAMGLTLVIATVTAVVLPRNPGFALFSMLSTLPAWLLLLGYALLYPPPGDKRFAFLRDLKHPDWRSLPFEPERAARLTAMKVVLDRQRTHPIAQGAWGSLGLAALQFVLYMFLGNCASVIPFLLLFLLYRIWRVRELHVNPSLEACHIVICFEKMAADLHLPPLSQDPTATSDQKRIMYGDWSHMFRGSIPNSLDMNKELVAKIVAFGQIGGVILTVMILAKMLVLTFMLAILPPTDFAEYLRERLKGGVDADIFDSILEGWSDLLRRWQARGMCDPELKHNAEAQRLMPQQAGVTPKQKREQQEKYRRWGS